MTVDVLYSIYVVHFATAFVTFLVALPFFYILGYGHVFFFAVLSGVFQLVPFLGQTVILLVLGGYALAIGDVRGFLLVIFVGYPFVAAIPDMVMRPLLMGARAGINPTVMFIGFFGGITLLGDRRDHPGASPARARGRRLRGRRRGARTPPGRGPAGRARAVPLEAAEEASRGGDGLVVRADRPRLFYRR